MLAVYQLMESFKTSHWNRRPRSVEHWMISQLMLTRRPIIQWCALHGLPCIIKLTTRRIHVVMTELPGVVTVSHQHCGLRLPQSMSLAWSILASLVMRHTVQTILMFVYPSCYSKRLTAQFMQNIHCSVKFAKMHMNIEIRHEICWLSLILEFLDISSVCARLQI